MADTFETHSSGLSSPAEHAAAVTPDDDEDLATHARSLYIGTAGGGALTVVTAGGETVAFAGVPAGFILPLRVARVKATGTDVEDIVALW